MGDSMRIASAALAALLLAAPALAAEPTAAELIEKTENINKAKIFLDTFNTPLCELQTA